MYPGIEKLREQTKDYLISNDPEFIEKYNSENKWNQAFEKKFHGKVNNLINNFTLYQMTFSEIWR